jgi:iron-sulfur cluster repair protein YtfE (RIC family)
MFFHSPFQELLQDHSLLSAEAQECGATIQKSLQVASDEWKAHCSLLQNELEILKRKLRLHFLQEEECVFPESRESVSKQAGRADIFGGFLGGEAEEDLGAHQRILHRMEEMLVLAGQLAEQKREEATIRKLLAVFNLTSSLLQKHVEKEDTLIFPMLERTLDTQQLNLIYEKLKLMASSQDLLGHGDMTGLSPLGE